MCRDLQDTVPFSVKEDFTGVRANKKRKVSPFTEDGTNSSDVSGLAGTPSQVPLRLAISMSTYQHHHHYKFGVVNRPVSLLRLKEPPRFITILVYYSPPMIMGRTGFQQLPPPNLG
jgi:hypothetical protein